MGEAHDTAVDVIKAEIQGLEALKLAFGDNTRSLAETFEVVVSLCQNMQGRLIVTGMGKSGHIARKLTSTLASTGTRASYVHPSEASHGDLGMISQEDVILALSNSGETPELGDILGYARRFNIPLVAITSGETSNLAKTADHVLLLPKVDEACKVTEAPTTSTAIMLALGDALAVAILRAKGFTATEFHTFHPGGKLGAALTRVSDLMRDRSLPLCDENATIGDAVSEISSKGFGCVGITNTDGNLVGIVTDGDLRRSFSKTSETVSVTKVMTPNLKTTGPETLAAEALALMSEEKITAIFVVDGKKKPLGLLHVHDCLTLGVI